MELAHGKAAETLAGYAGGTHPGERKEGDELVFRMH